MDEICQHLAALSQAVKSLQEGYMQLEERVHSFTTPANPPVSAASPTPAGSTASVPGPTVVMLPPEPRVPAPERFSGDRRKFRAFRNACELFFSLQPRTFSLEATKVGFIIALLQGEPQSWAHRLLEERSAHLDSMSSFFTAMAQIYDDPQRTSTAESALHVLQQGRRAVEDYVSDFRRWSSDTQWNDAALRYQFRLGLSENLKDELARVGIPDSLEELITLAIQIDRRLRERRAERSTQQSRPVWMVPRFTTPAHFSSASPTPASSAPVNPASDTPEPMQLGLMRPSLSAEERLRRRQNNLCLYCGEAGHYVRSCPAKLRKCMTVTPISHPISPAQAAHLALSISFQLPGGTVPVTAIIDSGACSCFIDLTFATQQHIPLQPKTQGLSIFLADGSRIKSGPVTQETPPLPMVTLSGHKELLSLDAITSPLFPVILGLPWLQAHNPQIDWGSGSVKFLSPYCLNHCLPAPPSPSSTLLCMDSDTKVCSSSSTRTLP